MADTGIAGVADAAAARPDVPGLDGLPGRPRDLPVAGIGLRALVDLLESLEVADLSDADVVGVVAGWQQVASMVTAAQAAAVNELVARRPVSSSWPSDDLACALASTGQAAAALMGRAGGLADHPVLADALRAGLLDARKVDVLLAETMLLPHADADRVLRAVLAEADGLTTGLLRTRARRLVAAVDPEAARKRAVKARADRCVRLEPAGDAMAWISALLPAPDAVAAFSVIDALADAAHTAADERTVAQRRADAFTDVFAAILATGTTPGGVRVPSRQGHAPGVHLTLAASTLAGADDLPGELAGYGPIPAAVARDLAAQADRYRPGLVDEAGHLLALGGRTLPLPKAPDGPLGGSPPGEPQPATAAGEVPDTAIGEPSDAHAGRGAPVGYRPGAGLRRFVVARDQTCMFPGCRQPAQRCDLDHVDPYDHDRSPVEQTIAANLQPLCRHHHRTKTLHGWRMHRDPATGDVHTTSPDGLTYVRSATTVVLTAGAHAALHGHGSAPHRRTPHDTGPDEPPPF